MTINVIEGTPEIAVLPVEINFGDVENGETVSQDILIQNTGTDTLFVSNILFDDVFYTTNNTSFFILPSNSTEITISFFDENFNTNEAIFGTYNSNLFIENNSENAPNINIPISINVTEASTAEVSIIPNSMNFGDVLVGETAWQEILIQNTGTDTLFITDILLDEAAYNINQSSILVYHFGGSSYSTNINDIFVLPSYNIDIGILFSPTDASLNYNSNMTLITNVGNIDIPLFANVIPLPITNLSENILNIQLLIDAEKDTTVTIQNTGMNILTCEILNVNTSGFEIPNWLNVSLTSNSLEPNETATIQINVDANVFDLATTVFYNLNFATNDVFHPIASLQVHVEVEEALQANFSANATIGCNGYAYFEDETSNNPTSWFWNFGDGSVSTEQNPIHFYQENGEYDVSLETCNLLNCNSTSQNLVVSNITTNCEDTYMVFTGSQNIASCFGTLLDPGQNIDYFSNAYSTTTILPNGADKITLSFSEFNIDESDSLFIYDGQNEESTLIGSFTGNILPNGNGIVVAESGVMTIVLQTDESDNAAGFVASWECSATSDIRLIQAKAFLEGAFDGTTMNTELLNTGLLPNEQPYHNLPWNYEGTEMLTNFPNNTTDWVLLEARDANDRNIVLETKAALLLNDGRIVDVGSNQNGVLFYNLNENESYYFVVRHRNHLDVITKNAIAIPTQTLIDFSIPDNVMQGHTQLKNMENENYALIAGDFDGNGVFTVADFNLYANELGTINSYLSSDCNLNKTVEISDFNLYQTHVSFSGMNEIRY